MTYVRTNLVAGLALVAIGFAGCTNQAPTTGQPESSPPPPTVDLHAGHAHAHPSEGPHHGDLIELGNEEYHAELVHDDKSVTIYILNGAADQQVPIDASEVVINTTHDGTPEQFQLAAVPDDGDPAGKSSRFVSNEAELVSHIEEHGSTHKLALNINGKSYRGDIAHTHDDHGHEHP